MVNGRMEENMEKVCTHTKIKMFTLDGLHLAKKAVKEHMCIVKLDKDWKVNGLKINLSKENGFYQTEHIMKEPLKITNQMEQEFGILRIIIYNLVFINKLKRMLLIQTNLP